MMERYTYTFSIIDDRTEKFIRTKDIQASGYLDADLYITGWLMQHLPHGSIEPLKTEMRENTLTGEE